MIRAQTTERDVQAGPSTIPIAARTVIECCLHDAAGIPGVDCATCTWLEEKLAQQYFNLVAAGQFKRGKSTVINALLGEPLLPAGVVPLTSVVTEIRSAAQATAHAVLHNGQRMELNPRALGEYVTERGNPRNLKSIARVIVEYPSPWLADGVRLVDTPGIGSVYEHNTDETRKYLPQADAVLFIASVDQPVSRAELDFLRDIRRYAGKTFCLLNKLDYLRPEELQESLAFAVRAIREALGEDVPIYAVSAHLALEGRQHQDPEAVARSGFPEFEQALRRFMNREKTTTWLHSMARSLERLLAQTRFTLDLESKVLIEPIERIEAQLAAFEEEKVKAERARADYRVLLEADAKALLKEKIEPTLDAFKHDETNRVCAEIERWAQELRPLATWKLQATLEERMIGSIRSAYDAWLTQEDRELSETFRQICARFWTNLQKSVDELMRRSSELFAVNFESVDAQSHWSLESGFYYKFWHEPTSLKILSNAAMLALPRRLAAPLIVRQTKTNATELIEIQAGRIRHDLEERLKGSVHDAQRHMIRQIEATVAALESAIDGGLSARYRSSEHAAKRSAEIQDAQAKLATVSARLTQIMPLPSSNEASH